MTVPPPADGNVADALRHRATARFSGVLRVDGQPGGTVHLREGRISACETSGAPSLEVILLRSHRVPEENWNAAFTAAAVNERLMTDELVERQLLGAGEIEALLRTALADAMFAVVSGRVDGWAEVPAADFLLPLVPAARPGWLLSEASRRGQVLAAFPGPALTAQDRFAIAPAAAKSGRGLGQGQDEILALVDGRRTARDMAFALGRGLYETLLQLSRLRAADVVIVSSYGSEPAVSSRPDTAHGGDEDDQTAAGLPRRGKDRPAAPRSAGSGRRSFAANIRMLRPRAGGDPMPDGSQ
jgi:hypothetical protein